MTAKRLVFVVIASMLVLSACSAAVTTGYPVRYGATTTTTAAGTGTKGLGGTKMDLWRQPAPSYSTLSPPPETRSL